MKRSNRFKGVLISLIIIATIVGILYLLPDNNHRSIADPNDVFEVLPLEPIKPTAPPANTPTPPDKSTPSPTKDSTPTDKPTPSPTKAPTPTPTPAKEPENIDSSFRVHFIDVGQGESILIEDHNHYMLIDGGLDDKGSLVVKYLQQLGVKELDYVIATHPHNDHIGGLDTVIDTFPVTTIFMPDVEGTSEHYTKLLSSIEKQGLRITVPMVESVYRIGESSFMLIAPHGADYESLNDYSVGIKLTYGNTSFILTADAQAPSEEEMLQSGIDLSADVMKINHHGSVTSNTTDFMNAVNPTHVIISAGAGNKYEHPHSGVMKDINNRKLSLYRTDKQGTIIISSDGDIIKVNVSPYEITKDDMISDAAEIAAIKKGY